MKRIPKHIGLLTLAASCGLQALAVPAKPGVMTVTTADGYNLNVRLVGDESFHQYFTEDGYPLFEKDGNFYYGDVNANGEAILSDIKAGEMNKRGAVARNYLAAIDMDGLESRIAKAASKRTSKLAYEQGVVSSFKAPARSADGNDGPPYERGYGLFPDQRFPAYGDQKAIVILVEYTDVKFNTNYDPYDYFNRMLNEDDFADYGGTGSAAQFFRLNSGDSFRPEFDVYGPIQLANNMAYYGGNSWWGGDDQNPGAMVKEACDALDDIVDFSEYDRNGDGLVDNIFIFYAGRGEASGGSADSVWPHSWNMDSAGFPNTYYDGVKVYTYGCSNEWESGRPDGVGTFVHEFSHVMGLPDLYATSYTSSFTPGSWSALDYGPYNNDGMTPPLYGAFERYALGWVKPRLIDRAVSATLEPVSENVCGLINPTPDVAKPMEFFLVENRQKEGWDTYIPGHGMLVWHVDYNSGVWSSNKVNNTPSHQYVDIEEADGTQSEYSRDGDSFPGTGNKTSFTSSTSPAMKTWSNQAVNYPITDIREENGIIYFDVLGGGSSEIPNPVVLNPKDVTAHGFTLCWEPVEGYDAVVSVYQRAEGSDEKVFVKGYRSLNVGSASEVTLTDLEPSTVYYYTVALSTGWESNVSEERDIFTGKLTLEYMAVNALEADEVTHEAFNANWNALEDANSYMLTVYELTPDGCYYDVCDFTNGVDNIGDWATTSTLTYAMTTYCGEAAPSLRLSNGSTLTSPVYDGDIKSVSFWHRGNSTTTGDLINVYSVADGERTLLQSVLVEKTTGGVTTEISDIPAGVSRIEIEFERKGTNGSLAIDDVKVGYGVIYVPTKMEEYDAKEVGNVTTHKVGGLKAETAYAYTVRATDGELTSRESNMVYVNTGKNLTGVNQVVDGASFAVSYNGLEVLCTSSDEIIVADYTGALVARGAHKVTLPRAGLYIVTVPTKGYVKKLIVR